MIMNVGRPADSAEEAKKLFMKYITALFLLMLMGFFIGSRLEAYQVAGPDAVTPVSPPSNLHLILPTTPNGGYPTNIVPNVLAFWNYRDVPIGNTSSWTMKCRPLF